MSETACSRARLGIGAGTQVPRQAWLLLPIFFAVAFSACRSSQSALTEALPSEPVGQRISVAVPLGLPPLPVPSDSPLTAETVELGKKLFFSPLLSSDRSISCATCHRPETGFADPRPRSTGVGGKTGLRNAPTLLNVAYNELQFWDGRAESLEEQASGPMMNALEMAHTPEGIEQQCSQDPELRRMFEAAFGAAPPGRSPVTLDRVTRALAAYQRTLLRADSPFDRFQYGGEKGALSAAAKRGLAIFRDPAKGNCAVCHTIEKSYALFTDNKFHNLGVGMNPEGELTDLGRFAVTRQEADRGAFRTPTLRDVTETAPYMHDGSLKTLKEVVDFYVGGGNSNPHLDKEMKSLSHLTKQERADLVAFLESLTGEPIS